MSHNDPGSSSDHGIRIVPILPMPDYSIQTLDPKAIGARPIYLNVAKNFTIRPWVNRSERLRGEPFSQ
jgi:hypothetical protein